MADQDILTSGPTFPAARPLGSSLTFDGLRRALQQPAVARSLPVLGALSAVAMAGLAWSVVQSPSQLALYQGLGDADKGAVANALQTSGIAYTLDRDSGSISVAEDEIHKARMMLAAQGLPKAAPGGDALIAALPMGSSRAVEGETLRSAREADLARTIEAVEAVKRARVHLATPEPSAFVRDQSAPAASIMLTMQSGRTLSDAQVRAIKHLVASSVPGLNPDQVSIIDQSGALLTQSDTSGDTAAFQLQIQIEDRYRQAINTLLLPIVGAGNFTAELHVDLDPTESQSTRESYPKDDRALRQEGGNRTSSATVAPPAIGIPGVLSNTPPPASQLSNQQSAPQAAVGNGGNQSEETYTRSFDVGREISVTHQPVGRLRRLTVAVALRDIKGGKKLSAKELASLENLVKSAVGFDAARGDIVALGARPFADAEADAAHIWDKPWFLVLLRQVGGVIAGLLVLIFVGRPIFRGLQKRATEQAQIQAIMGSLPASGAAITLDMIEAAPSYTDRATLVRDFVKQNPDRATLVVQQLVQEGDRD
jgi:flagellar M-ring protein FliF